MSFFILAGSSSVDAHNFAPLFGAEAAGAGAVGALLEATALLFVAYTGYARIATLGEEVREPRRTIPKAILSTTALTMLLYCAVALVGVGAVGSAGLLATWSFSAFNVLLYYALTNIAALRLPRHERLYPRWIAVVGLVTCLGLAFWIEQRIWLAGLTIIAAGLLWHALARRFSAVASQPTR